MLTARYVLGIGKMLDQTGEPRPGFLHAGKDNLEGANVGSGKSVVAGKKPRKKSQKKSAVKLRLEYEEDPVTGDLRIVQR